MTAPPPTPLDRFAAELRAELPSALAAGVGPVFAAFAPAMLDVMGGTAEFAGAISVDWPLADGVLTAVRAAGAPGAAGVLRSSRTSLEGAQGPFLDLPYMGSCARAASALRDETRFPGANPALDARAGSAIVRFTEADEAPTFVALSPGLELRAVLLPAAEGDATGSADPEVQLQAAAAMGYRAIAALCRLTVHAGALGETQRVEDPYFDGKLANVDPVTYASEFRDALSERWLGRAFLEQFGGVADSAVTVDAAVEYPVRAATTYVIAEHQRACRVVEYLHRSRPDRGERLGALLEESYLQARELGLVTPAAETFITEVRRRGAARGLLGARPARDGAIAVLVASGKDGEQALAEAIAAFERTWKVTPIVAGGTAAGANAPENCVRIEAP